MLARLMRLVMLAAFALAATWFFWACRQGHPAWAVAGLLAVAGSHALALAIEFVSAHSLHGDDPAPRATALDFLRAWCNESLAVPRVFCWLQPFCSEQFPNFLSSEMTGRRGVLLLHGLVCNRGLWNSWLGRLHALGIPVLAINLEPLFGPIDEYVPGIERAVRVLEESTGLAPVVVAHSMGGLALRRWWNEHGDNARVHHAITIAAPHQGTWLARLGMTPGARQMRRHSPWLLRLAVQESAERRRRFTCFYSHCDNIVFPPSCGTLPDADNRHLVGAAHLEMVDRPEPWLELLHRLEIASTPYE